MNKRLLTSFAAFFALAILFPLSSHAVTTTTVFSEGFTGATFPPAGWTASYVNGVQTYGQPAFWYRSSGGMGGANGSAVVWSTWAYSYNCYGSFYGPPTLTTPSIATGASSVDSQYVDFDLYYARNYYDSYYSNMGDNFIIMNGSTTLKTLSTGPSSYGDATFMDPVYGYTDPASYPSPSYWRHYHIAIGAGQTSVQITFKKTMGYGSCYYTYWYDDDIAIDNVTITNVHYDALTVPANATISFGNVPYHATAGPYYLTVSNPSTNSKAITLSNYVLGGTNPGDFTITRAPASIPIGASDSIGVTYTPQAGGSRSAVINVTTNADMPTNFNVNLTGFGLRPSIALPQGLLALFTHQWARFRQTITQSFLVTNTGQVPLHIDPASYIGGDYPSQYRITRLPTAPIAAGQSDTVTVAFSPTMEGLMTATIFIMSDAQNGTQSLALRGLGILPRLTINNMYQNSFTVNFDSVNVGADSCLMLQLYNPGSDTLAITRNFLSSRDYDFTVQSLSGTDTLIAPGVTKTIQVCFQPLKQGFREATVRVTTNIPPTFDVPSRDTSSFSIVFTGEGVPVGKFGITGPSMTDSILVNHQQCLTDTLWNLGAADITVIGIALSGLNATEFASSGLTFPFVLAANTHQTFHVCATPTAMGSRMVTVTANGTTNGEPTTTSLDQSVFGQLVADSLMVQGFPSVSCIGDVADTATIMVMNTGNVSTAYSASLTGTNASMFQIVGASTSSVENGGGTATFKVVFTPDAAHAGTSTPVTFNITGGAGGTATLTAKSGAAAITGSGAAPMTMAGATASSFSVTVMNNGTCPWTPGTPQVSAPFSYVSGGTTAIAPGGTGTLNFKFAPTTAGSFNQTVGFPSATGVSVPAASVTISGVASGNGVALVSEQNGYRLDQNYPNPFGAASEVEITLPTSANVRLVVLDQKGSIVETVMNQHMGEGSYTVRIQASELASGTYYYQMTANDVTLTRQMVVVK